MHRFISFSHLMMKVRVVEAEEDSKHLKYIREILRAFVSQDFNLRPYGYPYSFI